MISLILPYWNRQAAADQALKVLADTYPQLELEVLVIDDGSPEPFVRPDVALNLRVIRRPAKASPSSCISAWNEGVREAQGDTIVLSCIEVLHERGPVLEAMAAELERLGPSGYVLAAAWCPELAEWHCHSTERSAAAYPLPAGTGRSFCAMLSKDLFTRVGGFDEDYAAGVGYEDVDFVYRLLRAGARFKIRDDLVVVHPKAGASIAWKPEQFARNRALLSKKWPKGAEYPVTFACVQAGNFEGRGPEYVNTLYDMVARNMPPGVPFRFVCLTDNEIGLDPRIECLKLPTDLTRWWGKLYLFKRGLFADGTRVVFMDLDTVIIGRLDELVAYRGQFATLEDFLHPERIGPAVIAWEAGDYAASIWEEWVAEGKPMRAEDLGDLWWLNRLDQGRFAQRADRLQRLFPAQFVSYKRDCQPLPPKGARVVCFHGRPRPHEVGGWVAEAWKVGGKQPADFAWTFNVSREVIEANVRHACDLPHSWLDFAKPHAGEIAIVGGGPSLERFLPELKQRAEAGVAVIAVNGAFNYLASRGIVADWQMVIDARPENARFFGTAFPRRGYLLASQCAPELFAELGAGPIPITIVHMQIRGIEEIVPVNLKPRVFLSSGITVGMAAIAAGYCMGNRRLYVYGMDSSYETERHAYPQDIEDHGEAIEASAGGRTFKCAPWMVEQVQNFQKLSLELAADGCEIHVRCFGLLGHVAWLEQLARERAA